MGSSEFIAALDLGSSKIIAMAGRKNEQGILSVIASEKIASDSCIRRGCVHNVEDTAERIKSVIAKMDRSLSVPIEKVYVGVGGQSLHTKTYTVSKDVNGAVVNDEIIQSLYDECKSYEPEFAEILDIVSPEYYLDGRLESNPKGVQCFKIEAHYQLILGRPLIKLTLKKSVEEKAKLPIAGYIIAPIATAAAVLNDTEKEMGCALIEFGAGITYLSVYKGGLLRYLVAIPLGGKVVTKDICSLNISEEKAEELKINSGSALVEVDNDTKIEAAKLAEGLRNGHTQEINLNDLNDIIEARMDEILLNVIEQIKHSEYATVLAAGIIITGGGAAMKNISESIKNKTGMNVRLASAKKTLVNQAADWAQDYANAEVIGLLALGKESCGKVIERATPVNKDGQASIFGDSDLDTVIDPNRHKRKDPKKESTEKPKSGRGLLSRWGEKFDSIGKSLFDDEENENNNK